MLIILLNASARLRLHLGIFAKLGCTRFKPSGRSSNLLRAVSKITGTFCPFRRRFLRMDNRETRVQIPSPALSLRGQFSGKTSQHQIDSAETGKSLIQAERLKSFPAFSLDRQGFGNQLDNLLPMGVVMCKWNLNLFSGIAYNCAYRIE